MASYSDAVRVKSATLTASTVDVVTLGAPYQTIEVINRDASADLWVTIDRGDTNNVQVTPTVAGNDVFYVAPGAARFMPDDRSLTLGSGATTVPNSVVRLLSTGAVAYTVTGHDSFA